MPAEASGDGLEARGGSDAQVATGLPVRGRRWRRGELNTAFRIVASIVIPTFRFSARYHWHGPNRLPAEGAFVLAPNHFTNIDPLVVGTAVYISKRAPRFLAKASLFTVPVVGKLMSGMGQIPVERSGRTRLSDPLGGGRSLVEQGGAIIVYPEGTLTRDPDLWPMRGKTGAVRIALENDVPLIPMAHWGTQNIMARYGKKLRLFPPSRVDVIIGDPVDLSAYRGRQIDQQMLGEATELVMREITALLEVLRGERAPATRWDPAANNQKETGRFE
ncbi:1-acyl-sn-glycerol-3-phosphate acyltransferase [Curtobacterium flaccumfaciens]|uniref:1-acyl-sn-glycerol-3-phosphate acyltransferase n=1 Tax=Curtobacterium poinsettiae TaxID=159612 RepID=A0A9Q9P6P6_9MICO|nr:MULTISPECIES: lysophospholipid acyltransferase family protein [Curtobacterium]MBO9041225.1 1-acyl-sn-glycerol-3-phosphate acyltransferase [Curtobacterium flaccumfaciens pv. flaccumfaciens]UXN25288.1 1-acyl-sn-glycerol-3-phosphate acyltransferase [Curtobacterium flaccumfaciens]UYC80129.1 1-acyl-sn-glycerol-3-phosphate acyltransferase [Curtobacterium flaccumfaciens pv. poinsettiae]